VLHPSEQIKTPQDPISLSEKVGAETGVLALLERARNLKRKTEAYVTELVSDGPRFVIDSVRSVDDEHVNSPSLVLLIGTLEEEQSAYIIHADLARLLGLLKKTPLDGAKVVQMLKNSSWATGIACTSLRLLLIWSC
jgi:hypothetical protein